MALPVEDLREKVWGDMESNEQAVEFKDFLL
jgi:hypothetical protein